MLCKREGCNLPTVGKSSYCRQHRGEAHKAWVANIQAQAAERADRDQSFKAVFAEAWEAGKLAAEACRPIPIVVYTPAAPFGDESVPDLTQPIYYVDDGVCGFAWITIYPGNCAAANYAKKHYNASAAYGGGVQIWISYFNQCYARKQAFACAAAEVLRAKLPAIDLRVKGVYSGDRLD